MRRLLAALSGVLWMAVGAAGEPAVPATGRFLVASRQVTGSFFSRTVVLLLDYREIGALGLVVNRPQGVPLRDVLPGVEGAGERSDPIYQGGPVEPHSMWILFRASKARSGGRRVIGDVYASHSVATLQALLRAKTPPSRFHAYAGYTGWAPGQLEEELARGDWVVSPARPEDVFSHAPEALWEKLIRLHESVRVQAPTGAVAPRVGLEPTTQRLTAACSTN